MCSVSRLVPPPAVPDEAALELFGRRQVIAVTLVVIDLLRGLLQDAGIGQVALEVLHEAAVADAGAHALIHRDAHGQHAAQNGLALAVQAHLALNGADHQKQRGGAEVVDVVIHRRQADRGVVAEE